jgi:predicted AlkP superfamily phosphohydrolase/phosphomutase
LAPASRVLLIGLDAADPVLVERWIEDGTLPNLAALRRSGTYGRLNSSARYLSGSPWPTFYTGQPPSHHGIYHDYQWRHEAMAYARPSSQWLTATPFWRTLPADIRVIAYDVPMTLGCADGRGLEISGWASHDSLAPPASHPGDLLAEVRRRFGEWPISPEPYGPQSLAELLWLRQHLLDNVGRSCEVVLWLLQRPFDFAIVVFSALHRGGHRLWDCSSIDGPVPEAPGRVFDGSLRELYIACDQAIGRLLATVPADTTVMVFSLHGMTANSTRMDLLDAMLARVLGTADEASTPRRGLTRRLGEALPLGLRRRLTLAVPAALRDRAMTLWATGGIDWARTQAFTLRADLQGYIRINLEGREVAGVAPPAAYDALCEQIADSLGSFVDAATGEPLVAEVCLAKGLFAAGPAQDRLPDLVVCWQDSPAAAHEAVVSGHFGRIERATPGRIPNGRSGNHRSEGFVIARGAAVPPGSSLGEADILDLAPTALHLPGADRCDALPGTPVGLICGTPSRSPMRLR